jgi:hypothetical protein
MSMINTKMGVFLLAGFIAGAFVASAELRAFAANTVGSADIINNSIQSVDIKDGQVTTNDIAPSAIGSLRIKDNDVKAQDIAPDAVGASELQGVTKLIFAECLASYAGLSEGGGAIFDCSVPGAAAGDKAIALTNTGIACNSITQAFVMDDKVRLLFRNHCTGGTASSIGDVSIIVYDT